MERLVKGRKEMAEHWPDNSINNVINRKLVA